MKKLLLILTLTLACKFIFAQEADPAATEPIRDRMSEFIQKRLNLTREESDKFTPVFYRYFKEWRTTLRDNRGDRLVLQQKIIDLRLRYRNDFREILGERRGNQVYDHQEVFIKEMRKVGRERMENRMTKPPNKNLPVNN